MKASRSIPTSTIIPVLIYPDVREAVAWLPRWLSAGIKTLIRQSYCWDHHGCFKGVAMKAHARGELSGRPCSPRRGCEHFEDSMHYG